MAADPRPEPSAAFLVDELRVSDIPAVSAIDVRSFPEPWPDGAYERELSRHDAVWLAVRAAPEIVARADAALGIVGYAGIWFQVDEAHICTLAVDPAHRGQGLGARLLAALLDEAIHRGSDVATLEVRESNETARRLYQSFGFLEVGRRRGYYQDNGEDALILTTPPLADRPWRLLFSDRRRRRS